MDSTSVDGSRVRAVLRVAQAGSFKVGGRAWWGNMLRGDAYSVPVGHVGVKVFYWASRWPRRSSDVGASREIGSLYARVAGGGDVRPPQNGRGAAMRAQIARVPLYWRELTQAHLTESYRNGRHG